jgi:hypothetical protein
MTVSKYLGSVVLGEQCMSLVAMEDHGAALDLVNFGRAVFQSPLGRHFGHTTLIVRGKQKHQIRSCSNAAWRSAEKCLLERRRRNLQ